MTMGLLLICYPALFKYCVFKEAKSYAWEATLQKAPAAVCFVARKQIGPKVTLSVDCAMGFSQGERLRSCH